jgi:hypothetical protein
VALLYWRLPAVVHEDWQVVWLGKEPMAFSGAITAARRRLWTGWVFARADHDKAIAKLPAVLKETVLYALAPAV